MLGMLSLSVYASCDGAGGASDDGGSEPWSCEGEDVWEDPATGLCWMLDNALLGLPGGDDTHYMDWWDASSVCEKLEWEGYSDWRLPMIQELISLVRGCPSSNCPVEDPGCLEGSCNDTPECEGCGFLDGPGEGGCYWPAELGECDGYWSQSALAGYEHVAWYMVAVDATVGTKNKYTQENHVRCVRVIE
jgi:hypothetical protein